MHIHLRRVVGQQEVHMIRHCMRVPQCDEQQQGIEEHHVAQVHRMARLHMLQYEVEHDDWVAGQRSSWAAR